MTARDTVAVSRTDFHALLFVNVLEKNCTNPFKDDTRVEDEEGNNDALSAKELLNVI